MLLVTIRTLACACLCEPSDIHDQSTETKSNLGTANWFLQMLFLENSQKENMEDDTLMLLTQIFSSLSQVPRGGKNGGWIWRSALWVYGTNLVPTNLRTYLTVRTILKRWSDTSPAERWWNSLSFLLHLLCFAKPRPNKAMNKFFCNGLFWSRLPLIPFKG